MGCGASAPASASGVSFAAAAEGSDSSARTPHQNTRIQRQLTGLGTGRPPPIEDDAEEDAGGAPTAPEAAEAGSGSDEEPEAQTAQTSARGEQKSVETSGSAGREEP